MQACNRRVQACMRSLSNLHSKQACVNSLATLHSKQQCMDKKSSREKMARASLSQSSLPLSTPNENEEERKGRGKVIPCFRVSTGKIGVSEYFRRPTSLWPQIPLKYRHSQLHTELKCNLFWKLAHAFCKIYKHQWHHIRHLQDVIDLQNIGIFTTGVLSCPWSWKYLILWLKYSSSPVSYPNPHHLIKINSQPPQSWDIYLSSLGTT